MMKSRWEKVKEWEKDLIKYEIKHHISSDPMCDYYAGYCVFDVPPFASMDSDHLIDTVDVHGGITYGQADRRKFGFDCAHYGDENRSYLRDIDWLVSECERMAYNIMAVANGMAQRGENER